MPYNLHSIDKLALSMRVLPVSQLTSVLLVLCTILHTFFWLSPALTLAAFKLILNSDILIPPIKLLVID